jgi:hypothetical protein
VNISAYYVNQIKADNSIITFPYETQKSKKSSEKKRTADIRFHPQTAGAARKFGADKTAEKAMPSGRKAKHKKEPGEE